MIKKHVDYVCSKDGGKGAFREISDMIFKEKSLTKYLVQIRSIDNHLESHETLVKTTHSVIELNDASFNKNIIRPNLLFLVIAWLIPLNTLWFLVKFFLNKVRLW